MIISYDFGHGTGQDRGANGIVNEEEEIRKYAPVVIIALEQAGHKCIDCTPSQPGMSLNDSLSYRVNKANASGSQLHLCFHVNAFDGTAHGSEIEVASDAGEKIAGPVLEEICNLGFTNRGIKRPSLYVTRNTSMVALLIEPFFCDNKQDCNIYNPESLGNAIAKGLLRAIGGEYKPTNTVQATQTVYTAPPDSQPQKNNINVSDINTFVFLQHEFNVQLGAGIAEDNIHGPITLSKCPLIKQGAQGNITRWIQNRLNQLGFNCGQADGIFGNMTANAVRAFQRAHGLIADAIIGQNTWRALLGL